MARKKKDEVEEGMVEARILLDCRHGKAGALAVVSAADAEAGAAGGELDPHPDAVVAAKAASEEEGEE